MPFTVSQLRTEMSQAMVTSAMLTQLQLTGLMTAPNVDGAVNALAGPIQWGLYWADLDNRIQNLNGNIAAPTANAGFGLVQPPELLPKYPANANRGLVIILNDCFDDTLHWMAQPGFDPRQSLANHIRLLRI